MRIYHYAGIDPYTGNLVPLTIISDCEEEARKQTDSFGLIDIEFCGAGMECAVEDMEE